MTREEFCGSTSDDSWREREDRTWRRGGERREEKKEGGAEEGGAKEVEGVEEGVSVDTTERVVNGDDGLLMVEKGSGSAQREQAGVRQVRTVGSWSPISVAANACAMWRRTCQLCRYAMSGGQSGWRRRWTRRTQLRAASTAKAAEAVLHLSTVHNAALH